jgi:UDP-N-acetylmuramoylalanine--D-glutamate ligase
MKDKFVIYGCGISGISSASYLQSKDIEFKLLINDEEIIKESVKPYLNNLIYRKDFLSGNYLDYVLVRSPGIPHYDEIIKYCYNHNIGVISEIELAYHFNNKGKYIVITGSNGKTTTVTLISEILKEANKPYLLVGNIGKPLIDYIDMINEDTYVVLEISSFQLENTYSKLADVASITNLTPNHLNHVISLDYYYQSKLKLIDLVKYEGMFFINNDDQIIITNLNPIKKCTTFSLINSSSDYYFDKSVIYHNGESYTVKHPFLIGKHNQYNVLLAFAICHYLEIETSIIIKAIEEFKGVEFRLQRLGTYHGIEIYNDAKSTTPLSTLAAINSFNDKTIIHILLGGQSKNLSYSCLAKSNIKYYLYGEAKEEIKQELDGKLYHDIKEAYLAALNNAKANEVILLSPACASFDQFTSYIERGKYFTNLVKEVGLDYE